MKTFFFLFFFLSSLDFGGKNSSISGEDLFFLVCTRFREQKDKISTTVLSHSECVWSRLQKCPPPHTKFYSLSNVGDKRLKRFMASFIHREVHNYWEPNRKQLQVFKVYVFLFWVAPMFLFFCTALGYWWVNKKVCRKRRKEDNCSFLQPWKLDLGSTSNLSLVSLL